MKHEERLSLYGAASNPPFTTREEYLACAKAWKLEYAKLSEHIRMSRKADRLWESVTARKLGEKDQDALPADQLALLRYPAGHLPALRAKATKMIVARHQMKAAAQEQYLKHKAALQS